MQYLPLALFLAATALHLFACYTQKDELRQVTKMTLMPLLLLSYLFTTSEVDLVLCLAIVCGFLGDMFLLKPKDNINFLCGVMSFALGHAFYLSIIIPKIYFPSAYIFLLVAFVVCGAGVTIMFMQLRHALRELKIPVLMYCVLLGSVGMFSFALLCTAPSLQTVLLFIGSLLFLVSDSILSMSLFLKDIKRADFYVMVTYIPAQLLIVAGLMARAF